MPCKPHDYWLVFFRKSLFQTIPECNTLKNAEVLHSVFAAAQPAQRIASNKPWFFGRLGCGVQLQKA